ncbi:MAG: sodium/solute symporter [Phycisphaeraceae bacterium]|nr:sodium/solute symporter [Phycisphaeraceae bacterium]
MALIDYGLCAAYLVLVLGIGWRFRGRAMGQRGYYLAGGGMGWIPVGLSVMVSLFSSVNFVAFPAEIADHGFYVLASLPAFVLVLWPVRRVAIPLFRELGTINGYAYFERRYDPRVRRLASMIYLLWRVMWMAVALQACGRIISGVTGLPLWQVLVVVGLCTTCYTALGGLRGVIWTDVLQFIVLLGATAMALWIGIHAQDGIAATLSLNREIGTLRPLMPLSADALSLNPMQRITVWSALIGTAVALLARFSVDQMILQRYAAARSLDQARRGFSLNIWVTLVMLSLLAMLGLVVAASAQSSGLGEATGVAQLASLFRSLPAGVLGLLVAGLLAAAMSSVDSGLNACGSIWSQEFGSRDDPSNGASTGRKTVGLTVVLGLIAVAMGFAVGQLGTLFEIAARVINGLGSPLLALLLLGLFSRRTTARGMFHGGLLGTAFSIAISFGVDGLALHLYAVANLLVTLIACYALSLLTGKPGDEAQLAWTWRALRSRL